MHSDSLQQNQSEVQEEILLFVVPSTQNTASDIAGPRPTDPDLSYIAGFLDGEGCFSWKTGNKEYQGAPRIDCSNTYLPILDTIRRRFGGSIYKRKPPEDNCRQVWQWTATGPNARGAIRLLLPYLIEKAEQARLLLAAWGREPQDRPAILAHIKALKKNASLTCPIF
jgi:hypothetical protein